MASGKAGPEIDQLSPGIPHQVRGISVLTGNASSLLDRKTAPGKVQAGDYLIRRTPGFKGTPDVGCKARLVKCEKTSAGKSYGTSGNKIGNAHLK
jgi:hypothetical protein